LSDADVPDGPVLPKEVEQLLWGHVVAGSQNVRTRTLSRGKRAIGGGGDDDHDGRDDDDGNAP
jgi:hypothetical protein